jgi:hypothetical protein
LPERNPHPGVLLLHWIAVVIAISLLAVLFFSGAFSQVPVEPLPASRLPDSWRSDDPLIREALSQVNESIMSLTVAELGGYSTRYYGTEGNVRAGTYLHHRLASIPGMSVRYQDDQFRNVLGTLHGEGSASGEMVIVGAHYDSISSDPVQAPGATDNGCGVAIVLEEARILSRYRFNRTLVFAFWNAEETGFQGSGSFAQEAAIRHLEIPLYFNYDSSCYDPQHRMVIDLMYGRDAGDIAGLMVQDNSLYGVNATLTSNVHSCDGDHVPFRAAGIPTFMIHSESHGPAHTSGDTMDRASFAYAVENARLGAAVLARVAGVEGIRASPDR